MIFRTSRLVGYVNSLEGRFKQIQASLFSVEPQMQRSVLSPHPLAFSKSSDRWVLVPDPASDLDGLLVQVHHP